MCPLCGICGNGGTSISVVEAIALKGRPFAHQAQWYKEHNGKGGLQAGD